MVWISERPSVSVPTTGGFGSVLREKFSKWGDRLALVDGPTGQGYTYAQLDDVIKTTAGNLYHKAGIRKGDVVLIYLPNSTHYAILILAIPTIGGIVSGCNPLYTSSEVLRQLHDSNAVYLVTTQDKQDLLPELLKGRPQIRTVYLLGGKVNQPYVPLDDLFAPGSPAPEVPINNQQDVALMPYSSGTTGLPKGVMVTHYNIVANISPGPDLYEPGKESLILVFPLFHIGGAVSCYLTGVICGMTMIFYPTFDFYNFLEANKKYKTTVLGLPPPVVVRLAKDPLVDNYDLSAKRKCMTGASTISRETLEEVQQRLPSLTILQTYGMTETSGSTHVTLPGDVKLGSIGKVIRNLQCKVIDIRTGEELPPGKNGELCLKGDVVMKGYLNNPQATANTIKNGWLHTGDIGYCDESGHFFIVDRVKELIKYKGFQVPPAELEALLLTHPDIAEAAVTGIPDHQVGEMPRAFVVLKAGCKATEKDIQDYVKSRAAPHKYLRGGVEFLKEVPKSPSGKLLRRVLRDRFQSSSLKSRI